MSRSEKKYITYSIKTFSYSFSWSIPFPKTDFVRIWVLNPHQRSVIYPKLWNLDFEFCHLKDFFPHPSHPFKTVHSVFTAILDTYRALEVIKFTEFYETWWHYLLNSFFSKLSWYFFLLCFVVPQDATELLKYLILPLVHLWYCCYLVVWLDFTLGWVWLKGNCYNRSFPLSSKVWAIKACVSVSILRARRKWGPHRLRI